MALFGPKTTRLILHCGAGEPEPERLLIMLRSGLAAAQLEEHGWSPAPKATQAQVLQGVRRYLYEVQDRPGARMDFRALAQPNGGGRLELILTGEKKELAQIAPVLARIGAQIREEAGLAEEPVVKGVGA